MASPTASKRVSRPRKELAKLNIQAASELKLDKDIDVDTPTTPHAKVPESEGTWFSAPCNSHLSSSVSRQSDIAHGVGVPRVLRSTLFSFFIFLFHDSSNSIFLH